MEVVALVLICIVHVCQSSNVLDAKEYNHHLRNKHYDADINLETTTTYNEPYIVIETPLQYENAQSYCKEHYFGPLASIDATNHAVICELCGIHIDCWIDQDNHPDTFASLITPKIITDDVSTSCASIHMEGNKASWRATPCDKRQAFICQRPQIDPFLPDEDYRYEDKEETAAAAQYRRRLIDYYDSYYDDDDAPRAQPQPQQEEQEYDDEEEETQAPPRRRRPPYRRPYGGGMMHPYHPMHPMNQMGYGMHPMHHHMMGGYGMHPYHPMHPMNQMGGMGMM
eukprot:304451_1